MCNQPTLLCFAAEPSLQDLAHFHGSKRSGPIPGASTLGDHFAAVTNKMSSSQFKLSQSLWAWKSFQPKCLTYMLPQRSPALVSVSNTWNSQEVSHPSTIQAQCCLTYVFKWELVFPTWHGPLKSWNFNWNKKLFGNFFGTVSFKLSEADIINNSTIFFQAKLSSKYFLSICGWPIFCTILPQSKVISTNFHWLFV